MYDTLLPAYVHVFQTVIPRNRLPRMFSMNRARYSTVIFLRGHCKFAISKNLPILHRKLPKNLPRTFTTSPSKKVYSYTGKIIHRNWKFTHKKHIRVKLIMTSTSSKLKYCVQKTTTQRNVRLKIYYFAYMNSPLLF